MNRKNVSPPDDMAARNTQRSLVLSLFCFCIVFALLQPAAAENYNCQENFRRLTSAAAQPGALDDRDAAGGLSLDVNQEHLSGQRRPMVREVLWVLPCQTLSITEK